MDTRPQTMNYKNIAFRGFSWMMVLRASTRILTFLKTIFLAKILLPAQFGTYGIAMLVLGFLEVMTETGVNVFLIQEKSIERYINAAWIVSIVRGFLIALLIIASAPFIADFFNTPDAKELLYLISVVPVLRGFINPSVIKFQKELHFNREFWYRLTILLVDSVISVVMTLLLKNPSGIIIGLICGVVVEVILSHVVVRPLPAFQWNSNYLLTLFHRGKWITMSGFFTYVFQNADNIFVGKLLGPASLGVYQVAYAFAILPVTEIADVFSRVTFPIFSKISQDKDRLRSAFLRTLFFLFILIIPFGMILFWFSHEIIALVLGQKWASAATLLPLLALFGMIRAMASYTNTLYLSVGKQEYVFIVTLVSIVGLLLPIVSLIDLYGMMGAVYSVLIGSSVTMPLYLYFVWKIFRNDHKPIKKE